MKKKRKFLNKYNQRIAKENEEKVRKAIKILKDRGDDRTHTNVMKETGQSKTTIRKYFKKINEEILKQDEEKKQLEINQKGYLEAVVGVTLEDFISDIIPEYEELNKKFLELQNERFIGFLKILFNKENRNLDKQLAEKRRKARPNYEENVGFLNECLKIETHTSKEKKFLERELRMRLLVPLLKSFYSYFFGFGFEKNPEDIICRIEIKFNAFNGRLAFVRKRISGIEKRLVDRKFSEVFIEMSFNYLIGRLMQYHIEDYRLSALKNESFVKKDYEVFKKNILAHTKARLYQKIGWHDPRYETKEVRELVNVVIESFDKPKGKTINEKIQAERRRKQKLIFGNPMKRRRINKKY